MCHNNKDGRMQRILGNSYGQPIISDMWNSSAPYRFCNRDHKHPEYGRVLIGDSNGIVILRREHFIIQLLWTFLEVPTLLLRLQVSLNYQQYNEGNSYQLLLSFYLLKCIV